MADRPWCDKRQDRARRVLKRAKERPTDEAFEYLLPMRVGEEICIDGLVDVRVVRGSANVWGARLRPSLSFTSIVVPPWVALPRLRGSEKEGDILADEGADVKEYTEQHNWPIVICVRIPGAAAAVSKPAAKLALLRAAICPDQSRKRLRVHAAWPSLADHFLRLAQPDRAEDIHLPRVVLVAGAKNVGKSTCCRFLANTLMSAVGEVFFMETDLGQPELSLPGVVSMHRLKSPLLAFSESAQPSIDNVCVARFFVGYVTPSADPLFYARSVKAAIDTYLAACRDHQGPSAPPPLVVNSHGWMTGLGLDLVHAILRASAAQLVIRIGHDVSNGGGQDDTASAASGETSSDSARMLKRKRSLLARCGPLSYGLAEATGCLDAPQFSSVLVDLESLSKQSNNTDVANNSGGGKGGEGPIAVDLRWLRFASYFKCDLDPLRTPAAIPLRNFFDSMPRVRIPFRRLTFGHVFAQIGEADLDAAFTGTVVGLCKVPKADSMERSDDRLTVQGLAANAVVEFVAYAFLHALDHAAGEAVFYTGTPQENLRGISLHVLRGNIQWEPHSVRGSLAVTSSRTHNGNPLEPFCSSWGLEGMAAGARPQTLRVIKRRRIS